ncbi:UDP-N-acetylmuramoyl-L-alanyl-D-glutamate synthetase [Bacillaceae bacterium JMAK1]|nr:UDP-N-acetylmuramoyl-L-alanyl-D-glutamate synthetase [Bacillaceae bacterium JMAK1]
MMMDQLQGKYVLILGLARSGEAAARLLIKHGANVVVNEYKPKEELNNVEALEALGVTFVTGGHPPHLLEQNPSFIVKNPGIRYDNPIVLGAIHKNIPVVTEVELAGEILKGTLIAITGSNGKTTTTKLIEEMIAADHKNAFLAGNIGLPACEVAEKVHEDDYMVTEVSSFQLKGTVNFKPEVAVLLNIFDAHLDYHGTKDDYVDSKANVTAFQDATDVLVYNLDDPTVNEIAKRSKAKALPFSLQYTLANGVGLDEDKKVILVDGEPIIAIDKIVLPGMHNLENILAAIAVATTCNISKEAIAHVLMSFSGVEHRLQFVKELNGRRVYNDSKATNILATDKALRAFNEPIVLIAGGLDRGNEFDELVSSLTSVKALITYGETKEKLRRAGQTAGVSSIGLHETIEEAVEEAYEVSDEGDVILLSPACASWDQFKTFEERGEAFLKAVEAIQ